MTTTTERTYSSADALLATGLTYRQFNYLAAILLGNTPGSGHSRLFTFQELLELSKVAEFVHMGFPSRRALDLARQPEQQRDGEQQVIRIHADWELLSARLREKLEP